MNGFMEFCGTLLRMAIKTMGVFFTLLIVLISAIMSKK